MLIKGNSKGNLRNGTAGDDLFAMYQGGDDTVSGLGGDDTFKFGAAFTGADRIDGGADDDRLVLKGDYSGGVVFAAGTLVSVEEIRVEGGFVYSLASHDATVAAGLKLTVDATGLTLGGALDFDGSAETNGRFELIGSDFDDSLAGGAGGDLIYLGDGNDLVDAGGGNDRIIGRLLNPLDRVTGGAGVDTLIISGIDGSDSITFAANSMVGIDKLLYRQGFGVTTNDANISAGQTLRVDAGGIPVGHNMGFNGEAETDGSFDILASAAGDILTGGALNDVFDLSKGGNDTVNGGSGADRFFTGANFGASDRFTGGDGDDRLFVTGVDGGDSIFLAADTITGVDHLIFRPGFNAAVIMNDGNVAAGETLEVSAAQTGATFGFNASAETDGHYSVTGSASNDSIAGGALADVFDLALGGLDSVNCGGGDDQVFMGGQMTGFDNVAGGAGNDTVHIDGLDASDSITFTATTMTAVEDVLLGDRFQNLVTHDATVAAGELLDVDGSAMVTAGAVLLFNGTAETDGAFSVTGGANSDDLAGGAGADTLVGGGAGDTLTGRGGADRLVGGGGADTFQYAAVADSTSTGHDRILGLNLDADKFLLNGIDPTGVDAAVTDGDLSLATFDGDLAAAVGISQLQSLHTVIFTADGGDLTGHSFLVIDRDSNAGYQVGDDLVIDITGFTGTLDTGDF
jgi:Ca2+-binding RTX toxin-like protein